MPRRFAPRNDMQKLAACSHSKDALPGQIPTRLCIHPAAPLCTRRSASVFCIPSRQTPLATADALLPSAWHCAPRPYTRAHVLPSAWHCAPRPCKRRRLSVFCMSLRTSAHTGAAIRFPAAIPGKSVVLRANSQLFRIRREELLFGLCCRRSYGLPRRFAPRNDMLKTATRLRLQGTGAIRAPRQKRGTLHPSPAVRTLTKLVIASQCAHWCGNPFSPQGNLASRYYFGQIRMHFPVFALGAALCFVLPQENGLPRRFAPRNDRQKFAGYPRLPGVLPEHCRCARCCPACRA